MSVPRLTRVARTCLFPLYARALETVRTDGIIHDEKSLELTQQMALDLTDIEWQYFQLELAVCTQIIDEVVLNFLSQHPNGVIANLGAGLDTRFYRLDNGKITWYEIDLPEVIELRRKFFDEQDRYHFVPASVVETEWMDKVDKSWPTLFVVQGLANMLEEHEVRSLFKALASRFAQAEIVIETLGLLYVRMCRMTGLKWGMSADSWPDKWDPRIEVLDSWCIYDRYPKRWKECCWLAPIMAFGKNVHVILHLGIKCG